MYCPYCKHTDTRVLDSRVADEGGSIRRRRTCPECDKRFTTIEQMQLTIVKRSGATEPFVREKAVAGVRKACKGRPVSDDDLSHLDQVAYLRFASVYKGFESVDDFAAEVAALMAANIDAEGVTQSNNPSVVEEDAQRPSRNHLEH